MFLAGEMLVPKWAVHGNAMSEIDPSVIVRRKLPLNSLGVGRVSLEDKVLCSIHQAWLEYGPSEESLRALFMDTRAVLTDMGVEFGIANASDVLPEFFGRESTGERGFLFPSALQVPGSKHIVDLIVRSVLGNVQWFPLALANIKAIVQWLHKVRKREAIQDLVTRMATAQGVDPTELPSACSRHPGASLTGGGRLCTKPALMSSTGKQH